MAVVDSLRPAARGRRLEDVGFLRESAPTDDLRERLEEDGYLFVRGLLDREEVEGGRRELLAQTDLRQDYPMHNGLLRSVIQGPRIMDFFSRLFGAPARSYDFIWLRHQGPSYGIAPHCDTVFMGRGTPDVLTCWTPFGDIALRGGGLMLLEHSHRTSQQRLADYLRQDVDTYCENGPNAEAVKSGEMKWEHWRDYAQSQDWNGEITDDALELSEQWGGRWLTASEYRMGDVLIFTMRTVHAGTDNEIDTLRLSTDSRYQRADAPIDERWIRGEHLEDPVGHGLAAKQGKIC
jgi:hypothetical protein